MSLKHEHFTSRTSGRISCKSSGGNVSNISTADFARRYNLADRGTSYNSEELCGRFDFENGGSARFDGSGEPATSKGKGTKVSLESRTFFAFLTILGHSEKSLE